MKIFSIAATALLFSAATIFATPFAPTLLKLTAPAQIQYDFDNSLLTVPVTVVGKPATALFCVYTHGAANSITAVQNGHLGWHYVNKIDTSVYISAPVQFNPGSNEFQWGGTDDDGNKVPAGVYTYYIWAMDTYSAKLPVNMSIVCRAASGGKQAHIQEMGTDGLPLPNPVWYNKGCKQKWIIGNDPADSALIETTTFTLASGYTIANTLALQPDDHNNFFIRIANSTDQIQAVQKLAWVPNGQSIPETSWGDNSLVTWNGPGYGSIHPGPEIVGDFLWTGTNYYLDKTAARAPIQAFDWHDGSPVMEYDLSPWWSSVENMNLGALLNGGPNGIIERNGFLFLNAHSSCQKMMVNPAAEAEEDFVVWANQNGDYVLDHNFDENAVHRWACHDLTVGPYTYQLSPDNNYFSVSPAYDMGAVSFGLLAPDGDGIGYFSFGNETAGWKWFDIIVDSGSPFDGIYTDNQSSSTLGFDKERIPGIFFIGQDSIKGIITDQVGVKDASPLSFTVAQNSPNPFNPTTTISFTLAKAGKTTVEVYNVAGQKVDTLVNGSLSAGSHSVTWNAAKFSAGVYFYTVKNGSFSKTVKMTLLK